MPRLQRDSRRFGRRRALIHACIINKSGHRIPCIVRNISKGGALLEVDEPLQLPNNLLLRVETDGFEASCDIRHRTSHAIGVNFENVRVARNGCDTRFAGPELSDLQTSEPGKPRRARRKRATTEIA